MILPPTVPARSGRGRGRGRGYGCTRRYVRHGLRLTLFLMVVFLISAALLPYDSPVRLAARFNFMRFWQSLGPQSHESWPFAEPAYPIDLGADVLIIGKTGYGTRERMRASFEALSPKSELQDFLLIGDYASRVGEHVVYKGRELPVHDVVKKTLSRVPVSISMSDPRVEKYRDLSRAIEDGDEELALQLSKSFGWELDAMKDIPGLELAYEKFPSKKWYILLDDDTYMVQPSLKALLGHLDAEHPYYLGNAVGDYRGRFAHGGSAIILSQAAIRGLYTDNPWTAMEGHMESLSAIWGDRLIARALIRVGVFLDERFSHFFSGEAPQLSKIRADRFCSPILSFHGLATRPNMLQTGRHFQEAEKPVLWSQLWDIYGAPSPWRHGIASPKREGWDYVGRPDEAVDVISGVSDSDHCAEQCTTGSKVCLAWTWDASLKKCYISPWMIVGEEATGRTTGINAGRVKRLEDGC